MYVFIIITCGLYK